MTFTRLGSCFGGRYRSKDKCIEPKKSPFSPSFLKKKKRACEIIFRAWRVDETWKMNLKWEDQKSLTLRFKVKIPTLGILGKDLFGIPRKKPGWYSRFPPFCRILHSRFRVQDSLPFHDPPKKNCLIYLCFRKIRSDFFGKPHWFWVTVHFEEVSKFVKVTGTCSPGWEQNLLNLSRDRI